MMLYFKYLLVLLKAQMQYRTSFFLLSIGQFFVPFLVFLGLYFLFGRFGQIRGWDFYEVALCFGVIHLAFAISECFGRGFDSFSTLVINGEFDRILVRPRSTIVQVLGSRFEFTRIGRMIQSLIVLAWGISGVQIDWTWEKIVILVLMIASGIFIFAGIYILAATLCFWTIQALEIANVFTDGGREMAQYPLDIYKEWITRFFTFVIPFGAVNYIPLTYILGKADGNALFYMLTPVAGSLFIIPCLLIWQIGVRHYRSTGS